MPDFKFWDNEAASRFCDAPDYGDVAREALREMHRQVGDLVVDHEGIAVRGLLVRHLVMPNGLAGTEAVMAFLATEISADTYVNVMDQYRPCGSAPKDETHQPTAYLQGVPGGSGVGQKGRAQAAGQARTLSVGFRGLNAKQADTDHR